MRGNTAYNCLPLIAIDEIGAFLDYLIADSQPAAVPAGSGVLIRVPHPARFALHKLVISQRRPAARTTRSRKDVAQAAAVLDVLKDVRSGDIDGAGHAAREMGKKFVAQLSAAAAVLDDGLAVRVREAVA